MDTLEYISQIIVNLIGMILIVVFVLFINKAFLKWMDDKVDEKAREKILVFESGFYSAVLVSRIDFSNPKESYQEIKKDIKFKYGAKAHQIWAHLIFSIGGFKISDHKDKASAAEWIYDFFSKMKTFDEEMYWKGFDMGLFDFYREEIEKKSKK